MLKHMSGIHHAVSAILLTAGFIAATASTYGSTSPLASSYAEADQAFRERANEDSARKALALYRSLYQAKPEDPEAAWKLSMACYFVGLRLTKAEDDQEKLFKEGREAGLISLKKSKDCAPCHFWTAINMALYGQTVGVVKMLFTLGDIREHLRESARIDSGYAYGGAYRLLGTIEEKLPGILGGSNDRAREYYEKAVEKSPDEPLNRLFLARLLADEFSDKAAAAKVAQAGLSETPLPAERVESIEARKELQQELKKWTE